MNTHNVEVVGSVGRDEVPHIPRGSTWTALYERVLDDYHDQRVTVVRAASERDYEQMRSGVTNHLRKCGLRLRCTRGQAESEGEFIYYLEVTQRATSGEV